MKNKILNVFVLLSFVFMFSHLGYAQNNTTQPSEYSQEDLENLLGPIALYPDPLLAQILPASTYPLEIVAASRIVHGPKDFSKIDSQNWDPSVKAVAHYPDVLKMMSEKLDWTQQLGQAVLAQQQDVLQSVQTLRQQAKQVGNLKTNKQQIVRSSGNNIIEVMPASPEVIYVPAYNPQIVYTAPLVQVYTPVIHIGPAAIFASLFYAGFYWSNYSLVCGESYHWHRDRGWYNPYSSPVNVTNINTTNINNTYVNNSKHGSSYSGGQNIPKAWSHDNYHGNPLRGGLPSRSDLRPTYTQTFKNNFPENHNAGHHSNDNENKRQGSVYVPQGSSNFSGTYAKGRSWVPIDHSRSRPVLGTEKTNDQNFQNSMNSLKDKEHNHHNDTFLNRASGLVSSNPSVYTGNKNQNDLKPLVRPSNLQNRTPVNTPPVAMNEKSSSTSVITPHPVEKQVPHAIQNNKMRGLFEKRK